MNNDENISFGKALIEEVRDGCFKNHVLSLVEEKNKSTSLADIHRLMSRLTQEEKETLKRFALTTIDEVIFECLKFFDHHPRFSITSEPARVRAKLDAEDFLYEGYLDWADDFSAFPVPYTQ